jgi:hypothetical protein
MQKMAVTRRIVPVAIKPPPPKAITKAITQPLSKPLIKSIAKPTAKV